MNINKNIKMIKKMDKKLNKKLFCLRMGNKIKQNN